MASGIAEHHEARRREVRYLQKAWVQQKNMDNGHPAHQQMTVAEMAAHGLPSSRQTSRNTYQQQVRSMGLQPPAKNPDISDRTQRQPTEEYSAKIRNRYTSTDYIAQW